MKTDSSSCNHPGSASTGANGDLTALEHRIASAGGADREWADALLMAACEAHDAEDAAQMGEPSPWRTVSKPPTKEGVEWAQDRVAAMRAGVLALVRALRAQQEAGQ